MSKSQKQLLLGLLITACLLTCLAMVTIVFFAVPSPSQVRFFYVADVKAQETVEQSFTVDGPAELDLSNLRGDIRIVGSGDDEVVVTAVKTAWGKDQRDADAKLAALDVRMEQRGDEVLIEVYDPDSETTYLVVGVSRSNEVRFEISVPAATAVSVQNQHGNIELAQVAGSAELTNQYGDIAINGFSGSVAAESHHGNISLERAGREEAEITLISHYGDLTVQQAVAQQLSLDSHNGKVTVQTAAVGNRLSLITRYGDSELDTIQAAELTAENHNGNIAVANTFIDTELALSSQYGEVKLENVEADTYRVETKNGNIELAGVQGSLWLHSNYGDIGVSGASEATLDLYTQNGEIQFVGSLAKNADHQVESRYGEVQLRLPRTTAVVLDAGTDYGDIRCDFEVEAGAERTSQDRASGEELYGSINGGGQLLAVKTHNGNVVIEVGPAD